MTAYQPDSKAKTQAVVQLVEPSVIRFEALCHVSFHVFELLGGEPFTCAEVEEDVIVCMTRLLRALVEPR